MRFALVDRVADLQPGVSITTSKALTMAEEYLADHFPRFPVMPGVLMLESMTQAAAWLVRATDDFAHSIVVLKEARNVKFGSFVAPGQVLTVTAEMLKHQERESELKVRGMVGETTTVSGRLTLERYNLADERPELALTDSYLKRWTRDELFRLQQMALAFT